MSNSVLLDDEKRYKNIKENIGLDKLAHDHKSYSLPGDTILAIHEDAFLRKDKSQVLFYGRMFLDTWCCRTTPEQAVIITLMDGKRTLDDISLLLQQHCGGSKGLNDFKVRRVLVYIDLFNGNRNSLIIRNKRPSLPYKTYSPRDFIELEGEWKLTNDLEKPINLMWMPTSACQTNCVYCYATRRPIANSKLLSDQRVKELFDEAAELGVITVNVDGGDALCRPNVDELIAYATSLNIQTDLSTKAYVSKEMAHKLHDAGIKMIQFGFDAPIPDLFDKIVGSKGHFHRTVESIHNCTDAGIPTRTNSILTQETYSHINELVDLLHTLPLYDMKITHAFRSAYRHKNSILLDQKQKEWLRNQITILKEKYPQGKIKFESQTDYLVMNEKQRKEAFIDFPRCGAGREIMIITPDGKVSMCEQSSHEPEFIVGDVKHSSILEVWQGDKMKQFKTLTREQFKGTVCYDCESFEECFHEKGGCFIMTLKAYGTRFAPHPACPKAPKYEIPIQ